MDEYEGDDEKGGENEDKSKDKTEDGDAHVQVLGYDGKNGMAFTYKREIAQWKGKVETSWELDRGQDISTFPFHCTISLLYERATPTT